MTEQVRNDGGITTAEKILHETMDTLHAEFALMKAAWEDLRPWYKSRGAITFYAACDEIAACQQTLENDARDVGDALRASNALLVTFSEEELQEAMKIARSDDGGAAATSHLPSYNITTVR